MSAYYLGSVVHPDFISSKAAAKALWKFITSDTVYKDGSSAEVDVAMWALGSGDEGVIIDTRAMNVRTKNLAFDHFWKELELQLHSYKIVHTRRYG
jgi:hypothetical protein